VKTSEPPGRQTRTPYSALGAGVAGAGSALVAALASSCCVGPAIAPLVVAVLGAGGAAWAASLQPYSPYLLGGSLSLLVYGLWIAYKRRPVCVQESCPPRAGRGVKTVLWVSVAIWSIAAFLNLFLPRH
jgi:hypothetical protein